jgi:6-pyruvoyltetrahydropterin/6-carboxytetrahydropterin synthase
MVHLTRRYHFSAAHRLHSSSLTPDENARIYGKCNNPFGHGHNYVLEVTVAGEVSPETGMVCDLGALDRLVRDEVLEPMDEANLNFDVPLFRTVAPTTENLCVEIFSRLGAQVASALDDVKLEKVALEETRSNYFEYAGTGALVR